MDARNFVDAVTDALAQAEAIADAEELVAAGIFRLRVKFRDKELAGNYLRSFLPAQPAGEMLSVTLLSSRDIDLSSLVPLPREHGRVHADGKLTLIWAAGEHSMLYVFHHASRRGLVWLQDGSAPAWELSRPACPLINAASRDGPWTVAHGAAVGRAGAFLMLAGKGRAGKTTAALACATAGWDYAGDDYIFASSANGDVLPLYSSARLRDDMTDSFRDLVEQAAHVVSRDLGEIKHELDINRSIGSDRIRGGRIAAILIPRRQGASRIEFTPALRTDVFHALYTSTSQSAPGPMRDYAEKLSALAGRAPAFFVDTGQQPEAIPQAFERFLQDL